MPMIGVFGAMLRTVQHEVFAVAQRKTAEDYRVLGDLIDPTIDELAALQQAGGVELGWCSHERYEKHPKMELRKTSL